MHDKMSSARIRQAKYILTLFGIAYIILWIAPFLGDYTGSAYGSKENFAILRDTAQFKWHLITLFAIVSYLYAIEIQKKNWSGILAGLTFFLIDVFNEIWNGLIFTGTGGYSAYWMCSYSTGFQTLIGWNLEIIFCFLVFGLAVTKVLPEDKDKMMIFGKINNRHVYAFAWGLLGVVVELILNSFNGLIWNYWWWSAKFPMFLIIIAYWPFVEIAYLVYDLPTIKQQVKVVGSIAAVLLIALLVFIPLGWI